MDEPNTQESVLDVSNGDQTGTSSVDVTVAEKEEKATIIARVREKIGVRADGVARTAKRVALIVSAVGIVLTSSACFSSDISNPFKPPAEQAYASESLPPEQPSQEYEYSVEKDMMDSPQMEEMWKRVLEFWPNARFDEAKEYFFNEAKKYSEIYPKYSPELLLATFTSVSMAESNGGNFLGPNAVGARGWFQVIPQFHLNDFNMAHDKSYTEDQLAYDDQVSIEVGTWALMRYASGRSLTDCLKLFKGGYVFGSNPDDGIWWNRMSYSMSNLLGGQDVLEMGYIDYNPYDGTGMHSAEDFLVNSTHIGNVYIEGSDLNEVEFDKLGN